MEDLKGNFIQKTPFRYIFHFTAILLFALAFNFYLFFQDSIIKGLLKAGHVTTINNGNEALMIIIVFVILCYWADYRILKKINKNEYLIPFLLFSDVFCVFIYCLLLIFYSNTVSEHYRWLNGYSLDTYLILGSILFIGIKNWSVERFFKARVL
jgi:hypothetical protein